MDYDSPSFLKTYLESRGMAMQKKFGQNFLVNPRARAKIAEALAVKEGMKVWEIGPGLGALTAELLKRGAVLTVFEIDRGFILALEDIFTDEIKSGQLKIVAGDVLKTWKGEYKASGVPARLCGNLPYNIAAKIIADTVSETVRFERCIFTVQKEVAQRMAAQCGCADYSSFSVLCSWAYDIQPLMDLAGGSFWPRPNVASQAVVCTKKEAFPLCKNTGEFLKLQRSLFSSRRKTVKNNLSALYGNTETAEAVLKAAGIDPKIRAENLTVEKICMLADTSCEYRTKNTGAAAEGYGHE
ncbi:16S rRNA (adenine(1518)-N(6)/adenine(1519)-N(6))-dimethyltransferase RsmA [Treponema sp. OMZ 840]|uniref:16S rRNA (adenine(1518)-N(6)/adenine(1519)-N(6))- dimethyltransferase RsmA n=1 Tax=Treponema sp. OMZ 840 TaxID=244313 RepID=UPI003D8CE8E3